jgi:hypothetical protein
VSPADIRSAGFSIQEMNVFLGIDRLCEAGFTLKDYQDAGFPLEELKRVYSVADILNSGKSYTLRELLDNYDESELKASGQVSAADFRALGNISGADLRMFGFSERDISESGISNVQPAQSAPTVLQPPHARSMEVGDTWKSQNSSLEVTYRRLSAGEARTFLARILKDNRQVSGYAYSGSGRNCPRCGRLFVLISKYTGSDGMCGIERGTWVCDDADCGMEKCESYEGYGSIF